jgi:diketogulonate reductase-like aldo/keto reductase
LLSNHSQEWIGGSGQRQPEFRSTLRCSAAAVALAWAIRSGNVIAIPESCSPAHVKEIAVALSLTLTQRETLDAAHPPPRH